jgi:hypothetical protein
MTLRRARQILAKEGPRELFERVRNCNRDGIDGDAVEEYDRWGDPDYASSEEGEAEDEDEDDDVEGEGQDDDEIEKGEGQDETEMVVVEEEEEVEAGRQEPGDSSLRCCQLLSHFGGRWGCTLRCEFMLSPDCIHARAGLMMLFVLEAANRAPTARQPPANRLPPRPTHRGRSDRASRRAGWEDVGGWRGEVRREMRGEEMPPTARQPPANRPPTARQPPSTAPHATRPIQPGESSGGVGGRWRVVRRGEV